MASLRWACAGTLVYAAGRQILAELTRLKGRELELDLPLLFVGAVLYAAALACFASYWRLVAMCMGGRPGRWEAQRAYFVSQLGKYVPGKAWVILIRCALVDSQITKAPVVIASTFYETLVMMAAGSMMALVALLSAGSARLGVMTLSGGLVTGLSLAALPPVFRRLTAWTARSFQKTDATPLTVVTYTTWLQGFQYSLLGWIAVGLSLFAISSSLSIPLAGMKGLLLACGGIALAIVSGFAVLIVPAGLGVREWVLLQTLGTSIGPSNSVLLAVVARIAHVSVELFVAGILYLATKRGKPK